MNFLKGSKSKARSPGETVRSLKDTLGKLRQGSTVESRKRVCRSARIPADLQSNEEATRLITTLKIWVCGDGDGEPSADATAPVANEIYSQDLLGVFVIHIPLLEFEVSATPDVGLT